MRTGSRMAAVFLAAAVWIYAAMSVATRPPEQLAATPSIFDVAACAVVAAVD